MLLAVGGDNMPARTTLRSLQRDLFISEIRDKLAERRTLALPVVGVVLDRLTGMLDISARSKGCVPDDVRSWKRNREH